MSCHRWFCSQGGAEEAERSGDPAVQPGQPVDGAAERVGHEQGEG